MLVVGAGSLQQGDVIRDVPFLSIPSTINVGIAGKPGQQRLDVSDPDSFQRLAETASDGGGLVAKAIQFALHTGFVITQTCDIDHKDYITLARVFPLESIVEGVKEAIEHQEAEVVFDICRQLAETSSFQNLVYLGYLDDARPYVADLLRLQTFPAAWKQLFHAKRWWSLTDEALKYVQGRLNIFTGRYAIADGFWHRPGDEDLSRRLQDSPELLEQARNRLNEKASKAFGIDLGD